MPRYNDEIHKRNVIQQAAAIGLKVINGVLVYHQFVLLERPTLIVVPWPNRHNFALNLRDWERYGTGAVQFARLGGAGKLILWSLVATDTIEAVWDDFEHFPGYSKLGPCKIIRRGWVKANGVGPERHAVA